MPRPDQEQTARRFQSFDTENGYDCELPPSVRSELVTPRRPPIADRPNLVKSQPRGPLYFVLLVAALVLGGTAANLWRQWDASSARGEHVSPPPLAPQPAQTLSAPTPIPAPRAMLAKDRVGPRAQLVAHPVPRAQLVALPPAWPPLFVGGLYLATMPYNLQVLAVYRGELPYVFNVIQFSLR